MTEAIQMGRTTQFALLQQTAATAVLEIATEQLTAATPPTMDTVGHLSSVARENGKEKTYRLFVFIQISAVMQLFLSFMGIVLCGFRKAILRPVIKCVCASFCVV